MLALDLPETQWCENAGKIRGCSILPPLHLRGMSSKQLQHVSLCNQGEQDLDDKKEGMDSDFLSLDLFATIGHSW